MKTAALMVGIFLLLTSASFSMTVEEAYRSIPHARTAFLSDDSKLPQDEKRALVTLFEIVDEAIVLRVEALRSRSAMQEEYALLKARLASMAVPLKLQNVRELVLGAVKDQESYLKKKPRQVNASDKAVSAASGKLHTAYGELMGLYPNENAHNKQAFFDYLCALDFV